MNYTSELSAAKWKRPTMEKSSLSTLTAAAMSLTTMPSLHPYGAALSLYREFDLYAEGATQLDCIGHRRLRWIVGAASPSRLSKLP